MNIFWLIRGIPDFENIGPFVLNAKKYDPDLEVFVAFDEEGLTENSNLIKALDRLSLLIKINIVDLNDASAKNLDNFVKSSSIKTMIFEWGSGYPSSISGHVKWLFNNKKFSLRSRLIKCGKRNNINLICLPHAISMHKSVSIKPQKLIRKIVNLITHSNIIEDYSDRKIFTKLLFYNKIQCSNYRKFYNLDASNLGLIKLYKYKKEWIDFLYNKPNIPNKNIVFSIPKLHNQIKLNHLIETLEFLEKFCDMHSMQVICAFHPRVDIDSLPKNY